MVLCLAALVISMTSVRADYVELDYGTHEISTTLQIGEDEAYVVHLKVGDRLEVNLEVVSGGPVDFYLTNLTAYMVYKASVGGSIHFSYLYYAADYSSKNVGSISYAYTALVADTLVVVIDNAAWTEGGAEPIGEVLMEGSIAVQKNVWTWQNIAIVALVIAVIVAFMVGVKLPKRKR